MQTVAWRRCHSISFVHLKEIFKKTKILPSLRSKMSPEIMSNDPRLLIFLCLEEYIIIFLSTGRNILTFCTERQNCQTHVLDATWRHQNDGVSMRNMPPLWNSLSAASYSRRILDLECPNALTGNQAASFYFQVGTYSIVLSHHFARTKYLYIFGLVCKKKTSLLVKTHVFFMI